MFTRCHGCHTVHPVSAALLASAAGRYRCGKCNKVNNALDTLFDEWPAAGEPAPGAGEVPVLGLSIDLAAAAAERLAAVDDPGPAAAPTRGLAMRRRFVRLAWVGSAAAILAVSVLKVVEFQVAALPEPLQAGTDMLRPDPSTARAVPAFRDLEQIHIVSRELASQPGRPGRLRLSATIVNRASQSQPYPDLEVSLLDANGQVLETQRFTPRDYLAGNSPSGAIMASHAHLPLAVELEDPGTQAVGFELRFR